MMMIMMVENIWRIQKKRYDYNCMYEAEWQEFYFYLCAFVFFFVDVDLFLGCPLFFSLNLFHFDFHSSYSVYFHQSYQSKNDTDFGQVFHRMYINKEQKRQKKKKQKKKKPKTDDEKLKEKEKKIQISLHCFSVNSFREACFVSIHQELIKYRYHSYKYKQIDIYPNTQI